MAKDIRQLTTRMILDSKAWSYGIDSSVKRLNIFHRASKNVAIGLGALTAATTAGVVSLGAIAKKNLDAYRPFQSALTDLGKVGVQNISRVRNEILNLPPALGKATQLTQGYYQTISAGITEPKKALETLTVAAKASQSAHVGQSEVIKVLTKVMAGYGDQIKDTTQASDLLFTIEKLGQTSFAELVPVMGNLTSISKELNISQDELGASLAQMTQFTGSTAESSTQYLSILTSLMKPTEAMTELMDRYGGTQKAIKDLGFSKVMQIIGKETEASEKALGKLFGRKEAALGWIALAKEGFTSFNEKIVEMGNKTGATDRAFAEWLKTTEGLEAALTSNINKISIRMGEQLAPAYNAIISLTNEWFASNQDLIQNSIAKIPILITEHLIPSVLRFGQSALNVKTGFSLLWEWLHIKTIEAAGWFSKLADFFRKDTVKVANETTKYMKSIHHDAIDNILDAQEKHKTNLNTLQELLLKKITVTQKKRKDIVIKTNLDIDKNNNKLTESEIKQIGQTEKEKEEAAKKEKKRLDELYDLNKKFNDDIQRLTLKDLQYKEWALDQEYESYQELLHEKDAIAAQWQALDRWYAIQQVEIHKEANKSWAQNAQYTYNEDMKFWADSNKLKQKDYESFQRGRELVANRTTSSIVDAFVAGENVMTSVQKAGQKSITDAMSNYAQERLQKIVETAIDSITAFIAQGFSMSSASGFNVWDSLKNMGIYSAQVIAAMSGARAMAGNVFAGGGWLDNHPQRGWIKQGTTDMADDVLLDTLPLSVWASKNEFIMNAKSSKRWGWLLEILNNEKAEGGWMNDVLEVMAKITPFGSQMSSNETLEGVTNNLTSGAVISGLAGWGMAGDWIQGIPSGIAQALLHIGGLSAGFLLRDQAKGLIGKTLGFKKGGFLNVGLGFGDFIKDVIEDVKDVFEDVLDVSISPFKIIKDIVTGDFRSIQEHAKTALGTDLFFGDNVIGDVNRWLDKYRPPGTPSMDISKWTEMMMNPSFARDELMGLLTNQIKPFMKPIAAALLDPFAPFPQDSVSAVKSNLTEMKDMYLGGWGSENRTVFAEEGAIITKSGEIIPAGRDGVPFVGHPNEVVAPFNKIHQPTTINIINNNHFHGIDAESAKSVVRDYIIPELNFWRTSQNQGKLF